MIAEMPLYCYEHESGECMMGMEPLEVFQSPSESALELCPYCGEPIRRLVSRVSIKTRPKLTYERAAKQGLTTFKRVRYGEWEKVAGPGVDGIVADEKDKRAIEEEKQAQAKRLDLDAKY